MDLSVPNISATAGRLFPRCFQQISKRLQQISIRFHVPAQAQAFSSIQLGDQVLKRETQLSHLAATRRRLKTDVRSESDPDRLAALLRTANLLHDRSPPLIAAEKLARAGRRDLVEQVLEERYACVLDSPATRTERLLLRVMALYSTAGLVFHAERAFQRIPEKTERSLRALLAVYADNRLLDRARECFNRVPAKIGVAPGVGSCNVLVRALCAAGNVVGAEDFVRVKMLELGLPPDISTYNTLLEGYLKKGDQTQFERVVEEASRSGLTQTLETYNSRIAMLCHTGHTSLAGKVFEKMIAQGIAPSRATYSALIFGCCREGQLQSAKRWLGELRRRKIGLAANGGCYTAVIRLMVERGEVVEAVELCEECLERGWALPFGVVRGLVNGLRAVGKATEAWRVVELMEGCVKGPAESAWVKFKSTLPL